MKKRILGIILALAMAATMIVGISLTASAADGDKCTNSTCTGTYTNGFCSVNANHYEPATVTDGVYKVVNAGQLYWVADSIYKKTITNKCTIELTADIVVNKKVLDNSGKLISDTSGLRVWQPIGVRDNASEGKKNVTLPFTGKFNGNGHTISGLYLNNSKEIAAGLFGRIDSGAQITNVHVKDSYFSGSTCIGGIAGEALSSTKIEGCSFTGVVNSVNAAGGIAATIGTNAKISKCFASGSVVASLKQAGGIAGALTHKTATIENCYNLASVSCTTDTTVSGPSVGTAGGIAGSSVGSIKNCYNAGTVTSQVVPGGIVGEITNTTTPKCVLNCYYLNTSAQVGYTKLSKSSFANEINKNGIRSMTAQSFTLGEVCWLLNGSTNSGDQLWRQDLGIDDYPSFEGKYVVRKNSGYINYVHTHTWSYTVSASVAGGANDTITATCSNTDNKCSIPDGCSVTLVVPTDLTYSNSSKDATLSYSDNWEAGEATIIYNNVDRVNVTGNDISASVTLGEGTEAKTATVTYQVEPLVITEDMVTVSPVTYEYDGMEKSVTVTVMYDANTVLTADIDYTVNGTLSAILASTVNGYAVTVEGMGNYKTEETITKYWTVTKVLMNVTVEGVDVDYDENEHSIIVSGAPDGSVITYGTVDGVYDLTENPKYKTVGEYTVYYKVVCENYEDYTGSAVVKINIVDQAAPTILPTEKEGATTDSKIEINPISETGFGEVQYAISKTNEAPTDESSWQSGTVFDNLEKNTMYYVFVRFSGDNNHKPSASTGTAIKTLNIYIASVDTSIENGTVTLTPAEGIEAGDEVTLTVTPNEGYELDKLTVTDASGNPVTVTENKFTMPDSEVTVTATFKEKVYSVILNIKGSGSVAPSERYNVKAGTEITLTVTPLDNFVLSSLTVTDVSGSPVTVTDNKFTMPASNVTVSATFTYSAPSNSKIIYFCNDSGWTEVYAYAWDGNMQYLGYWPGTRMTLVEGTTDIYSIEVSADAPNIIFNNGSGTQTHDLTIPTDNKDLYTYSTDTWSDYVPPYTVTVDTSITNGTVTPSATEGIKAGAEVTLTVTPETGYVLDTITVTDANGAPVDVDDDNSFVMPVGGVTVTVAFKKATYTVTLDPSITNGSVTSSVTEGILAGTEVTITATPDSGYKFVSVTVTDENGNPVPVTDNKFTMPEGNVTVTATFRELGLDDLYVLVTDRNDSSVQLGEITKLTDEDGDGIYTAAVRVTLTEDLWGSIDVCDQDGRINNKISGAVSFLPSHGDVPNIGDVIVEYNSATNALRARFDYYSHSLVINDTENGKVTVDKTVVNDGETITIIVTPDSGYILEDIYFEGYELTEVIKGEKYTVTIPNDVTNYELYIEAVFKKNIYSVSVNPSFFGDVLADKSEAQPGEKVTLTILPDHEYALASLVVRDAAGNEVKLNGYSFVMPESNVTVTATFEEIKIHPVSIYFKGNVKLEGGELASGSCKFVLKDDTGRVIETVKCDENGDFEFKPVSFYGPVDNYCFTLTQIIGDEAGVTYDEKVHEVYVTVINPGDGYLEAEIIGSLEAEFINKYTAPEVSE